MSLNHARYLRCTPVHIRNMLPEMHPDINCHFGEGCFTINGPDYSQKQNVKHFKEDGRPLAFTYTPDQLFLYLVGGPEVTSWTSFFQKLISPAVCSTVYHHNQAHAYQNMFIKHIKGLYSKYLDIRKILTVESNVLYDLSTDDTRSATTINYIIFLEALVKQQYEKYDEEKFVHRSVPVTEKIKLKNKRD